MNSRNLPRLARMPEAVVALVTIFPSDMIEHKGVDYVVNDNRWYLCLLFAFGVCMFALTVRQAKSDAQPWAHILRAVALIGASTFIAFSFPTLTGRAIITALALAYFFWPTHHFPTRASREEVGTASR